MNAKDLHDQIKAALEFFKLSAKDMYLVDISLIECGITFTYENIEITVNI